MDSSESKPKDTAADPAPAPPPPAATNTTPNPTLVPLPQSDSVPALVPESKVEPKVDPLAETKTEAAAPSTAEPQVETKAEPTAEATIESNVEATSHPAPPADAANSAALVAEVAEEDPLLIKKEQEEFEGTVDVNNDIPTEKDLAKVGDLVVLDTKGASRPFKELYMAPLVAPRQLIIFIRHFFCGNCQEYLRSLSASIKPDDLLRLPTPTFITVIGCGRPELIPMYVEATACPFPVYADPTRKLYDILGMTRTWNLGAKPEYMSSSSMLFNSAKSILQGITSGRNALKGGDMKQVGGEFLFEDGECTWVHRMKTTRDHAEVDELRKLLGLDGPGTARPPMSKKPTGDIKDAKELDKEKEKAAHRSRTMSWGKMKSKVKGHREEKDGSGATTPELLDEDDKKLMGRPTV